MVAMTTRISGIDDLENRVGTHLGYSEWHAISQDQIQLFADATGDQQWIHTDPERAAAGPFGYAIAHGYLTLSLAPALLAEAMVVENVAMGVNYGCNKVRFTSPVPVGSRVRLGVELEDVQRFDCGAQYVSKLTFEIHGSERPACVAEVIYRVYA